VIKFFPYFFWYSERKRFNTGLPLYRLGFASIAIVASAQNHPYSPSEDVYALAPLLEPVEKALNFTFGLSTGKACSVSVRKGRNRDILVAIKNVPVAKSLSRLDSPFSLVPNPTLRLVAMWSRPS
jgi:hypothetical protein